MEPNYMKVNVKVGKETYELEQGLVKFVRSCRLAMADGFQAGQDLPAMLTSALADLLPAIQGVEQLDDEAKGDLASSVAVVGLMGSDLTRVFMEKLPGDV